jgi:hypothetical protein
MVEEIVVGHEDNISCLVKLARHVVGAEAVLLTCIINGP